MYDYQFSCCLYYNIIIKRVELNDASSAWKLSQRHWCADSLQ